MLHHEEWKDAQTFSWTHLCHNICVDSEWHWKDKVSSLETDREREVGGGGGRVRCKRERWDCLIEVYSCMNC